MLSLKDFSDKVIQNSKREPDSGRSGFGLVTPSKQPLGDPRTSREFTGWLSKQSKSDAPIMPPDGVVDAMGGRVNSSRVTEVGENGPELLVNNTVVPLNKHDRQVGQKRGNLPKGNLSALLSHIRHREYGGDVPAEEPVDVSQGETPNDASSAYGADVQGQPDGQQTPAQQESVQQAQPDQPDTGDIYSQIAQGYAQKIAALTNKDYGPKHHGGIGTILKGAGIGALQGLAHSDPRNGFAAELGAAVGGAGTGGVAGGIDSSNPQRAIDQMRLQKLQGDAVQNQKLGLGQAQLEDVMAKPGDRAAATQAKQSALAEKKREADNRQQSINRQRFVKNHGGRFDPTAATDADRKDLATFGETPESIGAFNINKPDVRTVAGKSYQWNGKTWDEAGLPTDGSKQIVDITVTDPDTKIQHTYATTSDHAAALQSALQRTGMIADSAAARQQAGFSHSEKMLELQDNYRKGFAEYQKTLDDVKAARDAQTKADLTTKANQQKATLMGLRTQLHLIEQQQKDQ